LGRIGVFWGEIHRVGKHMSGESFVSNLGELGNQKIRSLCDQRLRVGSLLGLDSRVRNNWETP